MGHCVNRSDILHDNKVEMGWKVLAFQHLHNLYLVFPSSDWAIEYLLV